MQVLHVNNRCQRGDTSPLKFQSSTFVALKWFWKFLKCYYLDLGFFSVKKAISASSHLSPTPFASCKIASWNALFQTQSMPCYLVMVKLSYAFPGADKGQAAACLFPARLSRKTSSPQKPGKPGGIASTDVRATPEELFSIGDKSSGPEEVFSEFKNAFSLSFFQFLVDAVCQEGCIPK